MRPPQLIPYSRGIYSRDILYAVWRAMEEDELAPFVFYSQPCANEAFRGDLVEFIRYFEPQEMIRTLFIVADNTATTVLGAIWFDQVDQGYSAAMGIFMRRRTRAETALAVPQALTWAFSTLGYQRVLVFTPWRWAKSAALRHGFQLDATLPKYRCIRGKPTDIYVLSREEGMQCQTQ